MTSLVLVFSAWAGSSELWGTQGELWEPSARLPDYTYAGYRGGMEPPRGQAVASVVDFGAVGDGVQDDSAAFQAAIDASIGVLEIPAGTWRIEQVLYIRHGDLVLSGAGPETVLLFPNSLQDLLGEAPQWSWNGGLIWIAPPESGVALTSVSDALRGDTRLIVEDSSGIEAGDLVELRLRDSEERGLGWHLHNDQEEPGDCSYQDPITLDWPVRVAQVVDGQTLELAQPLRLDIREEWSPTIYSLPALSEIGVEHLSLVFPDVEYSGHLKEPGYNGVFVTGGVVDFWLRDLVFINADNGLLIDRHSKHFSVSELRFEGRKGHHGFNIAAAADGLFSDVHYAQDHMHSVTVDHKANGNVFQRFSAEPEQVLELDHHRDSPYENLFTAFSAQTNFVNGGSLCAGVPGGARNTYWGLPTELIPPYWDHVQENLVGAIDGEESKTAEREWLEPVEELRPRNLYLAQRAYAAGEEYWDTGLEEDTGLAQEPGGCGGCGGGGGGGLWLVGVLGMLARRRVGGPPRVSR